MKRNVNKRVFVLLALLTMVVISGCKVRSLAHRNSCNSSNPRIEIVLLESDMGEFPASEGVIVRKWLSPNTWHPKPHHDWVNLQLFYGVQNHESRRYLNSAHHSSDEMNIAWPDSKQDGEPVSLSFESKMGSLEFAGQLGNVDSLFFNDQVRSYGTVKIDINPDESAKIKTAFGEMPSLEEMVSLIMCKADAQEIIAYADCKIRFSVTQAARLAKHNLTANDIDKLIENDYNFSADNIIKLAQHHVSVEYALEWKNSGYNLSADKLVYAKQRHLSAKMAQQWKDAGHNVDLESVYWIKQRHLKPEASVQWQKEGYQLDLEQLYWIKQRHLDPAMAAKWKKAGYKVDLEQLYWIKQRHLNPQNAIRWKEAGYDLNFEQLYWIKQRHLSAAESAMWKKAGYDLSLEDLYKLKQYNIDSDYAKAFADPAYEPLTVDELIKFKQSNISAKTISNLRKRK